MNTKIGLPDHRLVEFLPFLRLVRLAPYHSHVFLFSPPLPLLNHFANTLLHTTAPLRTVRGMRLFWMQRRPILDRLLIAVFLLPRERERGDPSFRPTSRDATDTILLVVYMFTQ